MVRFDTDYGFSQALFVSYLAITDSVVFINVQRNTCIDSVAERTRLDFHAAKQGQITQMTTTSQELYTISILRGSATPVLNTRIGL